jgi:hypothetical protein
MRPPDVQEQPIGRGTSGRIYRTPMRASWPIQEVLAYLLLSAATGCSLREVQEHQEFSLGTNGTIIAVLDGQRRVRELRHYKPDQSLKLRVGITYRKRDMERLVVFDPRGHHMWESRFTSSSEASSGPGSEVPSPGWGIRETSDYSGAPGDVHDRRSWYCGDDLLFRVHRTWPDDRSRVYYEVTGPSGVLLFTNTYTEK